jgi:serpin B
MKKVVVSVMALIMVVSIAGCTTTNKTSSTGVQTTQTATTPVVISTVSSAEGFQTLKADIPKITAPNVSDADLTALVQGNSAFAFDLYQQLLKSNSGNMFYSPYSISTALAMTYAGANGDTAAQMAAALKFTLPQAQLHPAFNQLSIDLASRGQDALGTNGKSFSLKVANALWGQVGSKIQPAFLNLLAQNYGAGLNLLDFVKSPEPSRVTINNWVSDQTNQKINNLLPEGSIDTSTRVVLTNAIYFDAAWASPFTKESTHNGDFNLLDGSTVAVPMMKQTSYYAYVKASEYQAIELPYSGNEIAMDIIMPDAGQFSTFEAGMTAEKVTGILGGKQNSYVSLNMPKFNFDSSFSLKSSLSALGMPVAFTNKADFTGITGKKDLQISNVVHKAYVAVDEEGTEAAAASAIDFIANTYSEPTPVYVTIDHPFIFLIRDVKTGAILFVGRVMNPAS